MTKIFKYAKVLDVRKVKGNYMKSYTKMMETKHIDDIKTFISHSLKGTYHSISYNPADDMYIDAHLHFNTKKDMHIIFNKNELKDCVVRYNRIERNIPFTQIYRITQMLPGTLFL